MCFFAHVFFLMCFFTTHNYNYASHQSICYDDVGINQYAIIIFACNFLWEKLFFHHGFNYVPIIFLVTLQLKQLSAVENVKTTINWLETIRNKWTKDNSIWVNIAYILHGTIYSIFACYMRTVQSKFRNYIISIFLDF